MKGRGQEPRVLVWEIGRRQKKEQKEEGEKDSEGKQFCFSLGMGWSREDNAGIETSLGHPVGNA